MLMHDVSLLYSRVRVHRMAAHCPAMWLAHDSDVVVHMTT